MNIIKKTIKCILLLIIFVFLILPFIGNNIVRASETNNYEVNMENIQNVDDVGYLYNFDGSPDYIYVDFIDQTGYAIFSEETLEILEYTNNGPFPYNSINEQKYYGGPYKYFIKNNNCFKNILTSEEFSFSTDFIEKIASFSRSIFNTTKKTNLEVDSLTAIEKISSNYAISLYDNGTTDSVSLPSSPPLDESNWIIPTGDAIYIDNVEYFMTPSQSPRHGSNNGTSCTTVAIQLLLSYNNYYNDRRIIAPEHLFGGWNTGSSDIFDRSNYTTPDNSPNVCSNPNIITSEIIGSNQAFHDLLFSEQITGFLTDAQSGLEDYLDNRGVDYDIECEMETTLPFDWGSVQTIDSAKITNKIDEGKPVVISTEESLNGTPYTTSTGIQNAFNHSVIAYGYQTLAPYTSSGNSNSYLGYIVHMGWDENGFGNYTNIWTNSSWYYSYLSLDINHNHNYNVVVNNIINNEKIEIRCGDCGHRKLDDLFVLSNNTIIDKKYDLVGEITIPSNINGIEVKGIGSEAFKNCKNLQEITIPNSVTNIDSSAFENCSYLQSVTLPTNLVAIGSSAFKGCESLESITIPSNVQYINDSAFENCFSLVSVIIEREISNITNLGDSAFDGCSSTLQIIVPQNRVAEYKNKEYWSDYKNRIEANDNTFVTHQLNCETNLSFNTNLESNKQKLYKIDVQSSNIYKFSFNSASSYNINLYDSNFNIVYSSQIMFQLNLIQGTYYFEIKFSDGNSTGIINTKIESIKLLNVGNNNILSGYIHNIEDYVFTNNSNAGFYKITLNATNSSGTIEYPEGCIKVYADEAKQQMLARLETIFYTLDAETQGDSNNVIVFLEYGESYYINIDLPNASYSSMYINIERLTNTYDIVESNNAIEHVILDENTTAYGDYIQRVEIHEAGTYTITFTHEGPQSEENLSGQEDPLYLYYAFYKEIYSPAEQFGDLAIVIPHMATTVGNTVEFTLNLQPGVYYIGYYNKLNNEPMSISITS